MSDEKNPFAGLDLNNLLGQVVEQARSVQGRMESLQDEVAKKTVEGSAGGGIVTVVANGKGRIKSIKIDPVAVDRRDVEMLEDLVVAACNDALRRAQELVQKEMGSLTHGMDLGALGSMLGPLGGGSK